MAPFSSLPGERGYRVDCFFFNDTATTEIYTLSLHDALPIWDVGRKHYGKAGTLDSTQSDPRSEEHTSELQSRQYLVCRLLLEKKTAHIYSKAALLSSWRLHWAVRRTGRT